MIKAVMQTDQCTGPTLLLGLSRKNCEKLLAGQPILIKGEEVQLPGFNVALIAGETEDSILADLEKHLGAKLEVGEAVDIR